MNGTACGIFIYHVQQSLLAVYCIRNLEESRCAIRYSTIVAQLYHWLPIIVILCVRNLVKTVLTKFNAPRKFPFTKEANCDLWAQHCILLSSPTLESRLSEQMHRLATLGHFISSESLSTLKARRITLLNFFTLLPENTRKLFVVNRTKCFKVCNIFVKISKSQLAKIKQSILEGATTIYLKTAQSTFNHKNENAVKYAKPHQSKTLHKYKQCVCHLYFYALSRLLICRARLFWNPAKEY